MRLAMSIFGAIMLAGPSPSLAEELRPGIVAVSESLFLAPGATYILDDYWTTAENPTPNVMLHLTSMDWLVRIRDADPVLAEYQSGLEILQVRDGKPWPQSHGSDWDFANRDNVPELFRIEDFDVQTELGFGTPAQINIHPLDPQDEFSVTCFGSDLESGIFDICDLLASYPRNRTVTLRVSVRGPKPFQELAPKFEALIARVREIADCLDVTNEPPKDPDVALAALLAENPMLQGCGAAISS